MQTATYEDRRVFERISAVLPVRYLDTQGSNEGRASTVDISANGVGMVVEQPLAAHTPLELWLAMPDRGEPVYSRGEVAWSVPAAGGRCRVGVKLEKAELMGFSRVLRAKRRFPQ